MIISGEKLDPTFGRSDVVDGMTTQEYYGLTSISDGRVQEAGSTLEGHLSTYVVVVVVPYHEIFFCLK